MLRADIIYVDASAPPEGASDGTAWCDAFAFLQDALASAVPNDVIRIADGIYKPDQGKAQVPGDRDASFDLGNGLVIEGGYAGCGSPEPNMRDPGLFITSLSGDLTDNDVEVSPPELLSEATRSENSYHVVTATEVTFLVLDGLVISGGNANEMGVTRLPLCSLAALRFKQVLVRV